MLNCWYYIASVTQQNEIYARYTVTISFTTEWKPRALLCRLYSIYYTEQTCHGIRQYISRSVNSVWNYCHVLLLFESCMLGFYIYELSVPIILTSFGIGMQLPEKYKWEFRRFSSEGPLSELYLRLSLPVKSWHWQHLLFLPYSILVSYILLYLL